MCTVDRRAYIVGCGEFSCRRSRMDMLNLVLWSVQGFLALFFLAAGAPKIIGRGLERWTGFSDLPRPLVLSIGLAEVLGAAGLVLPIASGILPWLTPLAAIGLAVIVLMAAGCHIRAAERRNAPEAGRGRRIPGLIPVARWGPAALRRGDRLRDRRYRRGAVCPWSTVDFRGRNHFAGHAGHRPGDEGGGRTAGCRCQRSAGFHHLFAWSSEAAEARPGGRILHAESGRPI